MPPQLIRGSMPITIACQRCGKEFRATPSAKRKFCGMECSARDRGDKFRKDLTGQKSGRWTVVREAESAPSGDTKWLCRCECGNEKDVFTTCLTSGDSTSCGCWHREISTEQGRKNVKPIKPGTMFNRLTVIERSGSAGGQAAYLCLCECGNDSIVRSNDLRTGNTKSCGCYNLEQIAIRSITHGRSGTREYNRWRSRKRKEADTGWTIEMEDALREMYPECVVCGSCELLATDHVIPFTKGGKLIPGNATILCQSCNSSKTNRDLSDLPQSWAMPIMRSALQFAVEWMA